MGILKFLWINFVAPNYKVSIQKITKQVQYGFLQNIKKKKTTTTIKMKRKSRTDARRNLKRYIPLVSS